MWTEEDLLAAALDECTDESDNDAGPDAARTVADPEVWMDHYSDDLLDLWYNLKEQCASQGFAILDTCAFPDFAQFCFQFSSGRPPHV